MGAAAGVAIRNPLASSAVTRAPLHRAAQLNPGGGFGRVRGMKRWLLVFVVALAACSSPNGVTGTFGGKPVAVKDAVATNTSISGINAISVGISEQPNLCPATAGGLALKAGTTVLLVSFGTLGSAPGPGTYNVLGPGVTPTSLTAATGFVYRLPADCSTYNASQFTTGATAFQTGTVTVTQTDGRAKGSFDVTLVGGETLKGTFDAPFCSTVTDPASCIP
jgi:hypothetical protein